MLTARDDLPGGFACAVLVLDRGFGLAASAGEDGQHVDEWVDAMRKGPAGGAVPL